MVSVGLLTSLLAPRTAKDENPPAILDGITIKSPEKINEEIQAEKQKVLVDKVRLYLESKNSPLAAHAEVLVSVKNWKMLIALSAIESQFCKRKIDYNCWGIGGDSAYRHYKSYPDGILDADKFLQSWYDRGKWKTVESMKGSYVVPGSDNWVKVVNKTLAEIESAIQN